MQSNLVCHEKMYRAVVDAVANAGAPVPITSEARAEIRRRLFRVMRVQESWLPDVTWERRSSME